MNLITYLLPLSGEILLQELLDHSQLEITAAVIPHSLQEDCQPVKKKLEEKSIPYRIPTDLNTEDFRNWVDSFDLDLGVSVGFDKKLPDQLIHQPGEGTLNIHPSLLPRYRGANPYFWVIRKQEQETGVSIHWMDSEFDTGPILDQQSLELAPDETMGTLFFLLNRWGIERTIEMIDQYLQSGSFPEARPQESGDFPEAPKVQDRHLRIDWQASFENIDALVRAANPFFGAFTTFRGAIVRIFDVEKTSRDSSKKPGKVQTTDRGPVVQCEDAGVLLKVVQMEQFYKVSGESFQRREKKAFEVLDRMI